MDSTTAVSGAGISMLDSFASHAWNARCTPHGRHAKHGRLTYVDENAPFYV
jgi:hypothetical protein